MPTPIATGTVLLPAPNTVFLTSFGYVLGTERIVNQGTFRFLKDHYANDEYIFAGEVRFMIEPWSPTPDVEPLDASAMDWFYSMGPTLGGVIRTQFTTTYIYRPTTFWYEVSPNLWALSGLGAHKAPVLAIVARYGDKEP